MRGAGAVSDYSLDRIRKMRADVAVAAGVLVSDVAIAVSAGSVLIDVTIIVASSATASVVSSTITRKLTSASTYVTSPLSLLPLASLPAPPCLPLTLSHPDLTSWHSASAIFTSAVVSIEAQWLSRVDDGADSRRWAWDCGDRGHRGGRRCGGATGAGSHVCTMLLREWILGKYACGAPRVREAFLRR